MFLFVFLCLSSLTFYPLIPGGLFIISHNLNILILVLFLQIVVVLGDISIYVFVLVETLNLISSLSTIIILLINHTSAACTLFARLMVTIQLSDPYLKLKFSQYPSIHTNYIISHCTTL